MKPVPDLQVPREATSLRLLVESRLRGAIAAGVFRPGQRLVERELCALTGVGRTSIREALRQLEAEGLVTTFPHRGPVVSTMNTDEAEQLYAVRALLEGFAGRECARRRDKRIIARLAEQVGRMHAMANDADLHRMLAAKSEFYAALLEGCDNAFVQRFLNILLTRVTVLLRASMSQPDRIKLTLSEMSAILEAVEAGDEEAAERACVRHVQNAAVAALAVLGKELAVAQTQSCERSAGLRRAKVARKS